MSGIKTFYFNTGVKPYNNSFMEPNDKWINGERNIPFDCEDVPDGAIFEFGAQDDKQGFGGYIVRPMLNTTMDSKFAYFKQPLK